MRYIRVKGIKAIIDKRYLSYSMANAVGSKNLRALKGLTKAENIIAILLRTGIIGLKD